MEAAPSETEFYGGSYPEVNSCMIPHAKKRQRAGEDC